MKTYTMTWKMYGKFGMNGYSVCRERIWPWPIRPSFETPVEFFLALVSCRNHEYGKAQKDFRLSCCGKLVARSATYQGV